MTKYTEPEEVLDDVLSANNDLPHFHPVIQLMTGTRCIFEWQNNNAPQSNQNKDELLSKLTLVAVLRDVGMIDDLKLADMTITALNAYMDGFLRYIDMQPRTKYAQAVRIHDMTEFMSSYAEESEIDKLGAYLDNIKPTEEDVHDWDKLAYEVMGNYLVEEFMGLEHRTDADLTNNS